MKHFPKDNLTKALRRASDGWCFVIANMVQDEEGKMQRRGEEQHTAECSALVHMEEFRQDQPAGIFGGAVGLPANGKGRLARPQSDLACAREDAAIRLQQFVRDVFSRRNVAWLRCEKENGLRRHTAAVRIPTVASGRLDRLFARRAHKAAIAKAMIRCSILQI